MLRTACASLFKNLVAESRMGPWILSFGTAAPAHGPGKSGMAPRQQRATPSMDLLTRRDLDRRVPDTQVFDVKVLETRQDSRTLCLLTPVFATLRSSRMIELKAVSVIRGGDRGIRATIRASKPCAPLPHKHTDVLHVQTFLLIRCERSMY